ncbi:MAG TPA: CHAT domain-containing tetratricopeptide repeat protein [Pyrinomonadaceae bacterium]|nr:CHAT domain-containing tetratricopeptide repeat protein [Pyrinomonadaceae bacterium]
MYHIRLLTLTLCVLSILLAGECQPVGAQVDEAKVAEANRLTDQVNQLERAGRYEEAIPLAERILALVEEVMGPNAVEVASALNKLVDLHRGKRDYAGAAQLILRSLAIYEKALGPEHYNVGTTLNNLALVYVDLGDYKRAEPLYQRSLTIFEKAFGPEHLNVAKALRNLADFYRNQGKYQSAQPLYERSLAIAEKQLGPEHPDVATVLSNLALMYMDKHDYQGAEPLYQRALVIREKALGPEHLDVAAALNNLAGPLTLNGNFKGAEQLLQRALSIREKALGPENPDVATTLNNLAGLYDSKGEYARAEPLYRRSLAIREKSLGPEHPKVANSLHNLATLYVNMGNYVSAEPLLVRALTIIDKTLGAMHPDMAETLTALAGVYRAKGDDARFEFLTTQALAIREKTFGSEHPSVATALSNLAVLYQERRDLERAQPLYERALAIQEKAFGPDHPEVASTLNNLATLYRSRGDNKRAEELIQRALAIREKRLGANHPDVALTLNNLAAIQKVKGQYEQAETSYLRSLAICDKALSPEHPDVAEILNNLAILYQARGDYGRALVSLKRAIEIEEKNISLNLSAGSGERKQTYLNQFYGTLLRAISLQTHELPQNDDARRLALTVILPRKGRAFDSMSHQLASLRDRADPDGQKLLDQLAATLSGLANLQVSSYNGKLTPAARREAISTLEATQEGLEDAISRHSAEFRAVSKPVTLDAVRQALPPDGALVELLVFQVFDAKAKSDAVAFGPLRYVAYVLHRGDDAPQFADLGEAAAIEASAAKFRAALQNANTPETQVKLLARDLDERVMRPVRKLLGSAKRIFLSPDGALNLVPFDAFVNEDGHYLIENYSFNYLTSGRDLLRLQVAGQSRNAPTIIANPLFDLKSGGVPAANGRRPTGLLAAGESAKANSRVTDFAKLYYPPLAGTADEAKSIAALLPQARAWTQSDATEANLKSVNGPTILHIATHGFFLPDQPQTAVLASRQLERPETALFLNLQQENPMLRSGLILAGVNQQQSGAGEDGVFTALEAASINLFGTRLVVLSACETGLGDVQNGTGVYGLRRALVLAGSETQVMSLWQVSDTATRDLMVAYYTRLQAGGGRI